MEDVSIVNIIQVKFSYFPLSDCSVCLVAGVGGGGKLSRPVYLAPHPLGYQSKIILLILLNLNYLNVKMYQLLNIIQVKFNCFLCCNVPYT